MHILARLGAWWAARWGKQMHPERWDTSRPFRVAVRELEYAEWRTADAAHAAAKRRYGSARWRAANAKYRAENRKCTEAREDYYRLLARPI